MAIHAHSTTAPALQPRLLRPFTVCQAFKPALAAAESIASQPCDFSDLAAKEALASTAQPLLPADTPEAVRSDIEALLADHGRAIHFKRALHEAFDFGLGLLDALDLPPLALDVIDEAIATLDALEASDEDREDDDPAEGTALERFGRGFIRAGADDEEDSDPAERDDHHGTEDDAFPWRRDPALVAFAAQVAHA